MILVSRKRVGHSSAYVSPQSADIGRGDAPRSTSAAATHYLKRSRGFVLSLVTHGPRPGLSQFGRAETVK